MNQKSSKQNLVFIILGVLLVVAWFFYQPQITKVWNSYVNTSNQISTATWDSSLGKLDKLSSTAFQSSVNGLGQSSASVLDAWDSSINYLGELLANAWNFVADGFKKIFTFNFGGIFDNNEIQVVNNTGEAESKVVRDCGISTAPDLKNPSAYLSNQVFNCLGESARTCESAKAILKDQSFPTVFEIMKAGDSCNFKLSYAPDSTLSDITGKKLAGQYIVCPVSIVKALDESKDKVTLYNPPSVSQGSKYGAQIYFYGTIGVFIENNLDQNKIEDEGCSGPYIQSVIKSYQSAQSGT